MKWDGHRKEWCSEMAESQVRIAGAVSQTHPYQEI